MKIKNERVSCGVTAGWRRMMFTLKGAAVNINCRLSRLTVLSPPSGPPLGAPPRGLRRVGAPSVGKSVNDPGCHLINMNRRQLSHIIVSLGGSSSRHMKDYVCVCSDDLFRQSWTFIGTSWLIEELTWFPGESNRKETLKMICCLISCQSAEDEPTTLWTIN